MIKPTVLLVWPRHIDFPVARWNLERFQKYFDGIFIGFSEHHINNQDLTNFLITSMPFAKFIDVERSQFGDWRNDAINQLLRFAKDSSHILFLEQDFLIKDDSFFEKILGSDNDFTYYQEIERVHPAFALVSKDLINMTSKDFTPYPPGDHFFKFFSEIINATKPFDIGININDLGVEYKNDYFHLQGLTQNYMNFRFGEPFFRPQNFLYYNWRSSQFPIQHPLFKAIQQQIELQYGHPQKHTFLNNFFPHFSAEYPELEK